jgi:hypothetical protein
MPSLQPQLLSAGVGWHRHCLRPIAPDYGVQEGKILRLSASLPTDTSNIIGSVTATKGLICTRLK